MTNEQIEKRAEEVAEQYIAQVGEPRDRELAQALASMILTARGEAREEALEDAAKVAESRIPTLQANGGSPAIRGHAIRINSIDIAAAIRNLKGADHEQ